MVRLINAPFDRCGPLRGSALGPQALHLAGLPDALRAVTALDTVSSQLVDRPEGETVGIKHFAGALPVYHELKALVSKSFADGSIPLVLGGDHSLSVASISAALEHTRGDLALLWIDAHADVNTAGTSPSANIHGMPVGALMRLPHGIDSHLATGTEREMRANQMLEWDRLLAEIVPEPGLDPSRAAWIGLRDVDSQRSRVVSAGIPASERDVLEQAATAGAFVTSMHEVDGFGITRVMEEFRRWIKACGSKNLWISFDVDVLDPACAPGTGTVVRGGLSYREGHYVAESLHQMVKANEINLIGLDLVETNPLLDERNITATMAVEWLGSLFGKTILARHPKWVG